jgi:hypothetical protein
MRKYLNAKIYCPTLTSLREENEEQKKEIDYKPTKKERENTGKKVVPISQLTARQANESRMTSRVKKCFFKIYVF